MTTRRQTFLHLLLRVRRQRKMLLLLLLLLLLQLPRTRTTRRQTFLHLLLCVRRQRKMHQSLSVFDRRVPFLSPLSLRRPRRCLLLLLLLLLLLPQLQRPPSTRQLFSKTLREASRHTTRRR